MNHYQAGATTGGNGALKNYMLAVLVGVLLGGAYAVTVSPANAGAGILSSQQTQANRLRLAKALRPDGAGATSIVNRGVAVEPARAWSI